MYIPRNVSIACFANNFTTGDKFRTKINSTKFNFQKPHLDEPFGGLLKRGQKSCRAKWYVGMCMKA